MSNRPDFIKEEDIVRWSVILDFDLKGKDIPILREVCYAGMFLSEELEKLNCSPDLIVRITYTAGAMSFGKNPWEIAIMLLDKYKKQELEFESNPDEIN